MRRAAILREANRKKRSIYQKDLEDANVLANQPPEPALLYTLDEIAVMVEDLMGIDAPRDAAGRILEVRPKGHWFEFEVAKVTTLIILTGAQIVNVFGVSPTATIKYQMGISDRWREEHRGKILVGESVWRSL